jgi:hypothetical protein
LNYKKKQEIDDMTSVHLPGLPKEKEFEEYVAALIQSGGLFIERNIIDREIEEILELDIVTTNYEKTPPDMKLIEVKSGDWGFGEIFKIKGWMCYLKLTEGALVVASCTKKSMEFVANKAKNLDINLIVIDNSSPSASSLAPVIGERKIDEIDITSWRFSYWVERNLIKYLKLTMKDNPSKICLKALNDYYYQVNSKIFFTENIVDRVDELYATYKRFPNISAKCAHEFMGDSFHIDYDTLPKNMYNETFYDCRLNIIQVSSFIEHRARLAILKSAIDFKLYSLSGDEKKICSQRMIGVPGIKGKRDPLTIAYDMMPPAFEEGLARLSGHCYFHRYPVFWQWFLWIFGGFILKDYEEQEYKILSEKTGIPLEEIPNAFSAYEQLFPMNDGWFIDLKYSNIRMIKLFPVPFMGIGANYRRLLYASNSEFDDLIAKKTFTIKDLKKWNNLAIDILKLN